MNKKEIINHMEEKMKMIRKEEIIEEQKKMIKQDGMIFDLQRLIETFVRELDFAYLHQEVKENLGNEIAERLGDIEYECEMCVSLLDEKYREIAIKRKENESNTNN